MNITLDTKEIVNTKTCNLFNLKLIKKIDEMKEELFDVDEAQDIIDESGAKNNVKSFIS